ncbi:MAG: SRPBCC family protein [Actinomycetota bacterium]|nr:SRPBCC family protein [Actinomycetota bacterium]
MWAIVGDPHHLPRWWPRVKRVEGVEDGAFTEVLVSDRGRPVRADFRVVESERPRVRRWAQEVADTPFERLLRSAETEVRLAAREAGTEVTLTLAQRLRGVARFGAFLVRGAMGRQVEEALDALGHLVER